MDGWILFIKYFFFCFCFFFSWLTKKCLIMHWLHKLSFMTVGVGCLHFYPSVSWIGLKGTPGMQLCIDFLSDVPLLLTCLPSPLSPTACEGSISSQTQQCVQSEKLCFWFKNLFYLLMTDLSWLFADLQHC